MTFTIRGLLLTLAFGLLSSAAPASGAGQRAATCDEQAGSIRVIVKNVRKAKGTITADLHGDKPAEFLKKKKKLLRVRVPARMGSVEMCLPVPGPGIFAIGLYHDVNGNRKFDKNFLGLTAEPYGVSNNPGLRLGAPKHADASFTVGPNGTTVEITLRQ
jgi:uncharacterized protein (DUF2141 family)